MIIFSTSFPNQTHAEALAAHQAAENAVRAAAGQVLTMTRIRMGMIMTLFTMIRIRMGMIMTLFTMIKIRMG